MKNESVHPNKSVRADNEKLPTCIPSDLIKRKSILERLSIEVLISSVLMNMMETMAAILLLSVVNYAGLSPLNWLGFGESTFLSVQLIHMYLF